jgi:membrane protein YqaA with SNARE-associated domain
MGQLIEALLSSSGWAALALLFMLPALEAPAFLGLVLPGELALLGGVLASQGRVPLGAALAVGVAGALAGDSAGYWIGRRWGPRLLTSGLGRRVGPARLHRVEALLLRGGGWPPALGSCCPVWPVCWACATGPSSSGRERPPPSGRPPMSCSATWPAPVGATFTSSPAGSA